jgi:hypothetical protein
MCQLYCYCRLITKPNSRYFNLYFKINVHIPKFINLRLHHLRVINYYIYMYCLWHH